MNTEELMQIRLNAMEEDLKQIFELFLSVYAEKEFLSRLLFLKEENGKNKSSKAD